MASALSLPKLPSVPAQIRAIEERQAALYAGQIPIPADVIDTILRTGSNRERSQLIPSHFPHEHGKAAGREERAGAIGACRRSPVHASEAGLSR